MRHRDSYARKDAGAPSIDSSSWLPCVPPTSSGFSRMNTLDCTQTYYKVEILTAPGHHNTTRCQWYAPTHLYGHVGHRGGRWLHQAAICIPPLLLAISIGEVANLPTQRASSRPYSDFRPCCCWAKYVAYTRTMAAPSRSARCLACSPSGAPVSARCSPSGPGRQPGRGDKAFQGSAGQMETDVLTLPATNSRYVLQP
jgi:hypothetical protein